MRLLVTTVSAAAVLLGAAGTAFGETAAPAPSWGVDIRGLSATVRPGDDFYRYVNEGWLKTAKPPEGVPFIDASVEVYLANEQRVAGIIAMARETTDAPGSPEQMISDYHRSHTDMARRNALGITPIEGMLATISRTKDRTGFARLMASPWLDGMIGGVVVPDVDNPARYIAAVGAAGLTMPSRDYYLSDQEPYVGHRQALKAYIADSFRRAGIDDPEGRAGAVLALEIAIAERQWTLAQVRDVARMNTVMSPAELKTYAPGFDWDAFLAEQGFAGQTRIKVLADTSVRDTAALFAATPLRDLQSFLMFKTLDAWATSLSEPWVQAHFDFHGKRLQSTPTRRPAELESIAATSAVLGEEIGRLYVANYFGPADRATVTEMVGYLRAAYAERIAALDWMDAATRAEALRKLERITTKIGFPERWHDRSGVRILSDDLVGNKLRLGQWAHADSLKKLAEGVRDWEFAYTPQEVNAGYSPSANSITFPAGILQPPFFDPKADPAVNFGSIAAVIGHEIGHAFDDQGSRQDGEGKLRNWWTDASRAEFEKRTAGLVDQFNGYEVLPGLRVNGRQNLGENIGDLGGLAVAHAAYRRYVADKQGGKAPVIDGFSGDQRFFLAWAQLWRNINSEGEIRRKVLSDVHSPGEFRVNGIVRNVDAWYDAFGVKPGDKLYLPPEQRVRIW
jgi:endothelin-converting enzyme/putative endopeptidase